jgi:hypothetical protein
MLHGIGLKTPANIWAHNPAVPLGVPIPLKRIGDGGLYQQSGGNRNVRNRNFSRGNKDSNVPETQTTTKINKSIKVIQFSRILARVNRAHSLKIIFFSA